MKVRCFSLSWKQWSLAVGIVLVGVSPVNAQPALFPRLDQQPTFAASSLTRCFATDTSDLLRRPVTGSEFAMAIGVPAIGWDPTPVPSSARVRLFRMMPGFITNAPGL